MPSNMDVFLQQQEVKNVPKATEDEIKEAIVNSEQQAANLLDFYAHAPRKLKRKLKPQDKFGERLRKKFQEKQKK